MLRRKTGDKTGINVNGLLREVYRMKRKISLMVLVACICLTAPVFSGENLPDPAIQLKISAYTSGEILPESSIVVEFSADRVKPDEVGIPMENSPLTFTPGIEGTAMWKTRRRIEFKPSAPLPGGSKYHAVLRLPNQEISEPGYREFAFDFSVISQAFEIKWSGFRSMYQDDRKHLQLEGEVITAIPVTESEMADFMHSTQSGSALEIHWNHSDDGHSHRFVVMDILRGKEPAQVVITWDGNSIGVDRKGKKVVAVPALGPFEVLQVREINEDTQYIEVRFSEPLQADQDMNGLIRVSNTTNPRFEVDGNIVRVYSSSRWRTTVNVTVDPGIRNFLGNRLASEKKVELHFEEKLPAVRFVGKGVILPTSQGLSIPIETVNLRGVIVEAVRIPDANIPQFLQVNTLAGSNELHRVGKTVWKKVVSIGFNPENKNKWVRYALDMSPLVEKYPGGAFRLRITFRRPQIVYTCPGSEEFAELMPEESADPENSDPESSFWDYFEESFNSAISDNYKNRKNPCYPGYYRRYWDHNITIERNVIISDIGLIAKKGRDNSLFVITTDLKTAEPMSGVDLTVLDFQEQRIASRKTDRDGFARFKTGEKAFLVVARKNGQTGYLKLDDGSALSMSQFDVSGRKVEKGLKGFIYGERGVWRPGDTIYLTFILLDSAHILPADHPVIFTLRNPDGKPVRTLRTKSSVNGFYSFHLKTDPDAPTGNWTASVRVGGVTFQKKIKIATIRPNRLKMKLDFGTEVRSLTPGRIQGHLTASWLHGAPAKNLKADINLDLRQGTTHFTGYDEYVFDDPVRDYVPESRKIFEGTLDEQGEADISAEIFAKSISPGILRADFTTRVFEPGGAFSIDQFSIPFHPYRQYVGIRVPKGDAARNMLLTDTQHTVRLALIDKDGNPVPEGRVEVKLYKINWRWWWDKGEESLSYVNSPEHQALKTAIIDIENGSGQWTFEIKYPSWGRYMIRAKDLDGGHCSGTTLYIDWPGWAGRSRENQADGATMLHFASDKERYHVGETVTLTIPAGKKGRALITIESGSRVLDSEWIPAEDGKDIRYTFTATPEMAPNVYAHVTLLQPHLQTANDLPIRMYGAIPIYVEDPETRLHPELVVPDAFIPGEQGAITVKEADGKPMTYTIAVVDEGLLDLTRFRTPDPWNYFYQRVALGVTTWDIFDFVAGAYGGTIEKLLSIGGDEFLNKKGKKRADRFPPMVRFLGPFTLKPGEEKTSTIDIPQYVGAVRVMVVAGWNGAFGRADKSVFVRKPLMILATLPRVLGPEETVIMPVSVFAMDPEVKDVVLHVHTEGPIHLLPEQEEKHISFSTPGDALVAFNMQIGSGPGIAEITIHANSGTVDARQDIELDVRLPGSPVVDVVDTYLQPNETWRQEIEFPGVVGTNKLTLEVSTVPPIDLERRLGFLIRYPHGCAEQTTSAVFPQLYLDKLMEVSPERQDKIQNNITAGISRLATFQTKNGGFAYWPGNNDDFWCSNYAGHFLVEARNAGYVVPSDMLKRWERFQRRSARKYTVSSRRSELIQAYRLYTLALAGNPEQGAMNRLREKPDLTVAARWRLAAAYLLAGQPEAAEQLVANAGVDVPSYMELSNTFGSDLRDKAMILETLCAMHKLNEALPVVREISDVLSSDIWCSTQTTAFALLAVARFSEMHGKQKSNEPMKFSFVWNDQAPHTVTSSYPIAENKLDPGNADSGMLVLENTGATPLYPRIIMSGKPAQGKEVRAENGLRLSVHYFTPDNKPLNPAQLDQGTDFVAEVTVKNTGVRGKYDEIALTHIIPSGWEISGMRLGPDPVQTRQKDVYQDIRDDRVCTYFDLRQGESRTFRVYLNASYLGKFYLPMIEAETMYDATINARIPGQWITVVKPGTGE